MNRLIDQFSSLSTFERMMIVHSGMTAAVDASVQAAIEQMKSTPLPTYYFDIFRRSVLEDAKALFSPLYKQDPTPGFGFGALERQCERTLESYFVDKHLSHCISSRFMSEVLKKIESAVNLQLESGEGSKPFHNRNPFYSRAVQSLGDKEAQFVENFREINIERSFMCRILERLRIQEEAKLFRELPLPQFSNPSNPTMMQNEMAGIVERGWGFLSIFWKVPKEEAADFELYKTYLITLYDERDRRMLKIIKESFQKDLAVREKNPHAPLTHLVTLESYEKAIGKQRQLLCAKITLVAVFVFFLRGRVSFFLGRSSIGRLFPSLLPSSENEGVEKKWSFSTILSSLKLPSVNTFALVIGGLNLLRQKRRPASNESLIWMNEFLKG